MQSKIEIRLATEQTLSALLRLESLFLTDQISQRSFKYLLKQGQADIWVAEMLVEVVGQAVVLYHTRRSMARLYSLVVDPLARGRGVGKALIQTAEIGAIVRGKLGMSLEVAEDNTPALKLYHQMGYQGTKRLLDYYEDGSAALRLKRTFDRTVAL